MGPDFVQVLISGNQMMIVCRGSTAPAQIYDRCKALVELMAFHLDVNISCYIGESESIENLYKQLAMLKFIDKENLSVGKIYFLNHWKRRSSTQSRPDFSRWSRVLLQGDGEQLYAAACEYIHILGENPHREPEALEMFFHDFLQMVYSVLKQKEISAASLFESKESIRVLENAMRSPEDLKMSLWMICRKAGNLLLPEVLRNDGAARACDYIDNHIYCDFSREDVADYVHMSPEHLSRIFKKKMGVTLVDYIQNKKIEAAKELLENTSMPVGEIAQKVGYTNFAYFSGLFKKYTKLTPLEYRKKH